MSLPPYFDNSEDYLKEFMHFTEHYQHLFIVPNTDFLVNNILDEIRIENIENIDIIHVNDLESMRGKSHYLHDFFEKMERLKPIFNGFVEGDVIVDEKVPLSPKKRHEIVYLAKEIVMACDESKCETVVDFGSGLGYLDQLIFQTSSLNVLGLECNETNYVGAKKRQRKYHIDSTERVKYLKHFVDENSDIKINEYLEDKFSKSNYFCITGLHACADLTIDAMNLFLKMDNAKSMVIMPCCYHKMKKNDLSAETETRFVNFPLSKELKDIFEAYNGHEYLKIPFLRLASQPPCLKEGSLEDSVFNLLSRAVLQLYASRHNYKLKRNKRKAVKLKTMGNNFSNYIRNAASGFTVYDIDAQNTIEFDVDELETIWREMSNEAQKKTAIFILLQNILQQVIENFVLYDRVLYLKEQNVRNCSFKRIFNEAISPRSLALIAIK